MMNLIGIVAGSGLDLTPVLDSITCEYTFEEFASLPESAVAGHGSRFIEGRVGESYVVVQCGRLHLYEGYDLESVVAPVEALYNRGVRTIVFTNAAGGLFPAMRPGDLMTVDRLRTWSYRGWPEAPRVLSPNFEIGGCTWRGAYHWVHGPCYETRAEIAALRAEKSSAVGMSTAPELLRAQQLGMRAAAVSCITNNCCTPQKLTHDHVLRTAAAASTELCRLLRGAIAEQAWPDTPVPSRNSAPSSR